jgi:xanthine dehydrogenase YagT iron-sulfur-binding subunit
VRVKDACVGKFVMCAWRHIQLLSGTIGKNRVARLWLTDKNAEKTWRKCMPETSNPTLPVQAVASETYSWSRVSRRAFLSSTAALMAAAGAAGRVHAAASNATGQAAAGPGLRDTAASYVAAVPMTLQVNGQRYEFVAEPRVTLLDALRETLNLTGTKKGCDRGQCGACTVLLDGRRINSCLTLAIMHQGQSITSVEGLAKGSAQQPVLHPVQAAFIEHDAFQCGYCTPGQLCSAVGAIQEMRDGMPSAVTTDLQGPPGAFSDAEIRERMSGNLCRCGAYPNIVAAVRAVLIKST